MVNKGIQMKCEHKKNVVLQVLSGGRGILRETCDLCCACYEEACTIEAFVPDIDPGLEIPVGSLIRKTEAGVSWENPLTGETHEISPLPAAEAGIATPEAITPANAPPAVSRKARKSS